MERSFCFFLSFTLNLPTKCLQFPVVITYVQYIFINACSAPAINIENHLHKSIKIFWATCWIFDPPARMVIFICENCCTFLVHLRSSFNFFQFFYSLQFFWKNGRYHRWPPFLGVDIKRLNLWPLLSCVQSF